MQRFAATPTALPSPKTLRDYALIAVPLCGVAGALNTIGFLALAHYTSHVTGMLSRVGADLATGHYALAVEFLLIVLSFLAGAMVSTFVVEGGTEQDRRLRYVKPLILELLMLLGVAAIGCLSAAPHSPVLLSSMFAFALGIQNATMTNVSGAAVRTTHMTGIMTDLGIELMRVCLLVKQYFKHRRSSSSVKASAIQDVRRILIFELAKAAFLFSMISSFVVGSLLGAMGYLLVGILGILPPAAVLAAMIGGQLVLYRRDVTTYNVLRASGTGETPVPQAAPEAKLTPPS